MKVKGMKTGEADKCSLFCRRINYVIGLFSKAGMELFQSFFQIFSVKMRVNFSGGNAFMTKHLLNGPQISTTFYQMGGKGMPKSMGRNIFLDTGFSGQVFNNQKYHDSA